MESPPATQNGRGTRSVLILAELLIIVGAAILAFPWYLAYIGDIPFAAPAPWAILVVSLIALIAFLAILFLRWGIRKEIQR